MNGKLPVSMNRVENKSDRETNSIRGRFNFSAAIHPSRILARHVDKYFDRRKDGGAPLLAAVRLHATGQQAISTVFE